MTTDKTLEAISRFNLNLLESIYQLKYTKGEDELLYEGIIEASCCLIPNKDIFESYKIFNSIVLGTNGHDILGPTPKERVLMLIAMMRVYQRKYKIENVIISNFEQKSQAFFQQYGISLTLKTLYVSKINQELKIRKDHLNRSAFDKHKDKSKFKKIHYFDDAV